MPALLHAILHVYTLYRPVRNDVCSVHWRKEFQNQNFSLCVLSLELSTSTSTVFFDLSLYLLPRETHVKNAATNNPPSFHFLPKEFTVFKHQCFSKYPSNMWTKKGKFKLSFLFTGSLSRDHFLFI